MAGSSESMRKYNLLATFRDREAANKAVGDLKSRGLREDMITLRPRGSDIEVAEAEMRDEVEGLVAGPGVIFSKTQTSGALVGGLLGAVVGAVVGFLIGAAVFGSHTGSSRTVGMVAAVVAFAAGLATAGAVAGGFMKPRYKPSPGDVGTGDPERPVDRADQGAGQPGSSDRTGSEIVLGVHVDDESALAASEDVLSSARPLRIDLIGSNGEVLNTPETGLDDLPVQPGSGRVRETGSGS